VTGMNLKSSSCYWALDVLRQNRGGGLWVYRVLPPLPSGQGVLWGHEA
jgi:hypothetical protein